MDITLVIQMGLIAASGLILTFWAAIDASPSEPKNYARSQLLACEHLIYMHCTGPHKMLVYHANAFSFELHQEEYELRAIDAEQLCLSKNKAIIGVFRSPLGFKAWLVDQHPLSEAV